tara:strand:- start:64 stop:840 length:777 start_codon:yes stop_codon:yes gene_type:complete
LKKNIVILSANRYSAYSSSVLHLLLKNNFNVSLVVAKKIYGINEIKFRLKREGFEIIKKIYVKIFLQILSTIGLKSKKIDGFTKFFNELSDVKILIKKIKIDQIPFIETQNFHKASTLDLINSKNPDLIIFTGGGLIRQSLLDLPKIGVLNCHMGILPDYRGMDCTSWALINKDYNNIGCTTHLMDKGVDTGPIIKKYFIDINKSKNYNIETDIEYIMANCIIESVKILFERKNITKGQVLSDGKQYYTMHPFLKKRI